MNSTWSFASAAVLGAAAIAMLVFSFLRPSTARPFLMWATPSTFAVGVAFTLANYFDAMSARIEVVGALAKELPFIVILSVLCIVQADFLHGIVQSRNVRRILHSGPWVLSGTWVAALVYGLSYPSAALSTFAAAPVEFLVFKSIFLIPEGLFSALVAYLFVSDVSPTVAMLGPNAVDSSVSRRSNLRVPAGVSRSLRLRGWAFSASIGSWFLLAVNALVVAFARVWAPTGLREAIVSVGLVANTVLIGFSLIMLLAALVLYATQSHDSRLGEKVMRWFFLRDEIDLKTWQFSANNPILDNSITYNLRKSKELLDGEKGEDFLDASNEELINTAKLFCALTSGTIGMRQLQRFAALHEVVENYPRLRDSLAARLKLPGFEDSYELQKDPLKIAANNALLLGTVTNRQLSMRIDSSQWDALSPKLALIVTLATHHGYLRGSVPEATGPGVYADDEIIDAANASMDQERTVPAM